jgi:small conductance mechanosensitive channel
MKSILLTLTILLLTAAAPVQAQDEDKAKADIPLALQQDLTVDHTVAELQLLVIPLTVAQLGTEAEEWQSYVQSSMSRIASLKVAAMSAQGPELDQIHEQINEASEARTEVVEKFLMIVESMEAKGGDPEQVALYRNYIKGAVASEFQATDMKTILSQVLNWVISAEGGVGFLFSAATIIGSLFVLIIVARFIRALAAKGIRRISQLSQLLQDFLLKAVFWLTFAIGLMIVLSLFGVNITPLFAVLGGASFILAFAMQETLGNLAAGLMIMINKPFDVGNLIDTNGVMGQVEAVSIVSTTVRTLDNQVVILPNSQVWGSIITNVTVSSKRRVDMVFGIGYGDDIETAITVLESTVKNHPLILEEPEPMIKVHELADSSVNFICRPWTKTKDYWTVYWDLTRQVKEGFDRAGVSIPFPQRDVHLYSEAP